MLRAHEHEPTPGKPKPRNYRIWRWVGWVALATVATLVVVLQILVARAGPIVTGRVIETLSTRFDSRVELDHLQLSISHGLNVTGGGLRIYSPDEVVADGAHEPLIAVPHFEFHAALLGLMFKPMHVGTVRVQGLAIHIPPRQMRQQGPPHKRHLSKTKIILSEIVCDDSRLVIGTAKPDKDPKLFLLKHIVLHDVGPSGPWSYDATLINAIPRGEIHATGSFGPWNTEAPGKSGVTGRYLFDHADLNTIKGIGGMLHSVGTFEGQLDRIAVRGTTEVPDFSLDTANHPMRLWTKFSAIVDGTTGDTYLRPVQARLGESEFTCQGAVINIKGKGHRIDLDVDIPQGRIQDFLQLSIKTEPAVMSGVIETKATLHIRPGKESVSQKLSMRGSFRVRRIHFNNPAVEDKVDMLSLRAKGDPDQAKPGAADVHSRMTGDFKMHQGRMTFRELSYVLPGAAVQLSGVYSLDGKQFKFTGKVRTKAKLSRMVASRWKGLLLKPFDPFFHKHGAGAEIPVKISGTKASPHFGLDLGGGK